MSECGNTTTTADHVPCTLPAGHRTGDNPTACRSQARYVATINIPGYLPQDDEPATFDTAREAWEYLAEERERGEDAEFWGDPAPDCEDYSATHTNLRSLVIALETGGILPASINADGTGTVYGSTPGYDGQHDLGLAYSVSLTEE